MWPVFSAPQEHMALQQDSPCAKTVWKGATKPQLEKPIAAGAPQENPLMLASPIAMTVWLDTMTPLQSSSFVGGVRLGYTKNQLDYSTVMPVL